MRLNTCKVLYIHIHYTINRIKFHQEQVQSNSVELTFATLFIFINNDNDTVLIIRNEMLNLNRVLP